MTIEEMIKHVRNTEDYYCSGLTPEGQEIVNYLSGLQGATIIPKGWELDDAERHVRTGLYYASLWNDKLKLSIESKGESSHEALQNVIKQI